MYRESTQELRKNIVNAADNAVFAGGVLAVSAELVNAWKQGALTGDVVPNTVITIIGLVAGVYASSKMAQLSVFFRGKTA